MLACLSTVPMQREKMTPLIGLVGANDYPSTPNHCCCSLIILLVAIDNNEANKNGKLFSAEAIELAGGDSINGYGSGLFVVGGKLTFLYQNLWGWTHRHIIILCGRKRKQLQQLAARQACRSARGMLELSGSGSGAGRQGAYWS